MAGIITHAVVAREISKRLPFGKIEDMGAFYMGNLAPDAIHVREGYIRSFKKYTHFRDDIPDRDFEAEYNRTEFHKRVTEFITETQNRKDTFLDLYRGYVTHNLVDELYLLTIRKEFCITMEKQGIDQSEPLFYKRIITDMRRNDFLLVKNYEGMEDIRLTIEQASIQPVEGYVSAREMEAFREWMLEKHFYTENEFLQPIYINYEKTLEFIQMAAEDIIKRLSDDKSFPKMF